MALRRRRTSLIAIAAVALVAAAACSSTATQTDTVLGAQATPTPAIQSQPGMTLGRADDAELGAFLTGRNGMTLYVLTKDTPDTSTCTGACAMTWPPLTVDNAAAITGPTGATGDLTLITRPDGTMQVAYYRQPLYYFSGDAMAGDANGQGKNGVWFVAVLAGPGATPTPVPTVGATLKAPASYPAEKTSGY